MSLREIKITAKWKGQSTDMSLPGGSTAQDLITELGVSLSTKIVMRNGMPIPSDEKLNDGDEIIVVETVSGG